MLKTTKLFGSIRTTNAKRFVPRRSASTSNGLNTPITNSTGIVKKVSHVVPSAKHNAMVPNRSIHVENFRNTRVKYGFRFLIPSVSGIGSIANFVTFIVRMLRHQNRRLDI